MASLFMKYYLIAPLNSSGSITIDAISIVKAIDLEEAKDFVEVWFGRIHCYEDLEGNKFSLNGIEYELVEVSVITKIMIENIRV